MPVKYSDLEIAVEYVSANDEFINVALICRTTGKTYFSSNFDDEFDEFPDDAEDPDKYVAAPHRRDLDLGRRLVGKFTGLYLPNDWERVESIFSRKGAYRRFREFLAQRDLLDTWYQFQEDRTKQAILRWAESEGIEVVDDQA